MRPGPTRKTPKNLSGHPGSQTPSLLSYILRYISLAELDTLCRVGLRDPMHLCTCVSEEGGDGEDAGSETPSLLSCTLRYSVRQSHSQGKDSYTTVLQMGYDCFRFFETGLFTSQVVLKVVPHCMSHNCVVTNPVTICPGLNFLTLHWFLRLGRTLCRKNNLVGEASHNHARQQGTHLSPHAPHAPRAIQHAPPRLH
jgi:hypothetical protein